jgi:hypothetical protein
VSGSLTAANAVYTNLTSLTVASPFAITTPLTVLELLEVKDGGVFVNNGVIGTQLGGTGVEPIEVKIAPLGSATVTTITNLKTSTIEGALTAVSFIYDTTGNAPTPLNVAAGGSINGITFPVATPIDELGTIDTVTIGDYTVPVDKNFTIPGDKTLTIAAGKILTYNGPVAIVEDGNLVLATDTGSSVAKIAGAGTISAGATVISGNWEAVGTGPGTLTIATVSTGTTITGETGATGLKASAAGAGITQKAIASNNLSIVTATIDLNGVASITLVAAEAANNPATLTLPAATSIILTSSETADGTALTGAGGLFAAAAADDKAVCSAISGTTGIAIYKGSVSTTKLVKLTGGSVSHTIKATAASTAGGNITIDKDSPIS